MKPYSDDWKEVRNHPGVEYSEHLDLFYTNGRIYDALSAAHNGIIGIGRILRDIIKGEK